MRSEVVHHPFASIRLFAICGALEWSHLPAPGALADQHPDLLVQWSYMFVEQSKYEKDQRDAEEKKAKTERAAAANKSRTRGGVRR